MKHPTKLNRRGFLAAAPMPLVAAPALGRSAPPIPGREALRAAAAELGALIDEVNDVDARLMDQEEEEVGTTLAEDLAAAMRRRGRAEERFADVAEEWNIDGVILGGRIYLRWSAEADRGGNHTDHALAFDLARVVTLDD